MSHTGSKSRLETRSQFDCYGQTRDHRPGSKQFDFLRSFEFKRGPKSTLINDLDNYIHGYDIDNTLALHFDMPQFELKVNDDTPK